MKRDWEARVYPTPFEKGGKIYRGNGEPIETVMKAEGWLRKHGIAGAYADITFVPDSKDHFTLTLQEDGTVEIYNLPGCKWPIYGVVSDGNSYFEDKDESDFVDIQDEGKEGASKKDDDASKMRLDEIEDDEAGEDEDEMDDAGDEDQDEGDKGDDDEGEDEKPGENSDEEGDEDGEDEEPVIRRLFARMYDGRRWRKQAIGDWEAPRQIQRVEFGLLDEDAAEEHGDYSRLARQKQARITFMREPEAPTSKLRVEIPEGMELTRQEDHRGTFWFVDIPNEQEA